MTLGAMFHMYRSPLQANVRFDKFCRKYLPHSFLNLCKDAGRQYGLGSTIILIVAGSK